MVRCDVAGGPYGVIPLELPAAWAAPARVELVGDGFQLTSESRGATTYWMIRPEHPIWRSGRLIVRSAVPLARSEGLAFPDLVPLGRGSVDTYLAITNATGREIQTEGSTGLQPIDFASKFADAEFAQPRGAPSSAFHVRRETTRWTLKIQVPGDLGPAGARDGLPRLTLVDIACTLRGDSSAVGVARYEVAPRSGPFLTIVLPAPSEAVWASVNANPVRPLRAASGQWLIPLEDEVANRVRLVWNAVGDPARGGGRHQLALPEVRASPAPALVTVRAPESIDVRAGTGALEPIAADRLELERAEWLEGRTAETLTDLDRGSLRDRETLAAALVQFGMLLRSAERAALWDPAGATQSRQERARRVRGRSEAVRAGLNEMLESAGLEDLSRAAQADLGLAPDDPRAPAPEIPEPTPTVRIGHLGQPHHLLGKSSGLGGPEALAWSPIRPRGFSGRGDGGLLVLAAVAVPILVFGLVLLIERNDRWSRSAAGAALAILAAGIGPWAVAAGLALALLGRFARA
jgi:hypothetical protein